MIELHAGRILIDGTPTMIMAGEVHYFRVPRPEWADRLDKVVEIGCTCVASYIPWLFHELPDATFDLTGRTRPERDLGGFIDMCAERGLMFFARPGPFVMAELKNEGLPYRLYTDHPEIVPVGWDSVPAPTRTVDYLAEAFLAETDRWYAAVMPILATRLRPIGGPVIGVQLDNEIGMLAWISNSPDLTDAVLDDLLRWCRGRYGEALAIRYPISQLAAGAGSRSAPAEGHIPAQLAAGAGSRSAPADVSSAWADAVRSPAEEWAAALRVDLGWFMRERFARYVAELANSARRHGVSGVPFMINIHGTEGGDGVPFAIGVSQLYESYAGLYPFVAGSDHYLGDLSLAVTADIHFINAAMAAVNGPNQPLTSLEFEAGTGDYSGGLDQLYDPSTVDLKIRLCLAQGNRMINYYLLSGGVNPQLDVAVGDGNDRISFTGERHGTAAPIGPLGERGLAFAATARITHAVGANGRRLADMNEELDDVTVGFWPDAFMTEYHHPGSATMTKIVDDLASHRGPGHRKALWSSLLYAGYRFTATNLQDVRTTLPRTVALSTGLVLDAAVQQRLVEHVAGGGSLLLMGRLPQRDQENHPCSLLADALGLRPGALVQGSSSYSPSLVGHGFAEWLPETRVGWLAGLEPADLKSARGNRASAEPLLTDVEGRACAVTVDGLGRAVVATAELPSHPALFTAMLGWLGSTPGLRLRTSVPGVVVTTTATSLGERMLHVLNPTGYTARVQVDVGDPTGLLNRPLVVPPRTGWMLGLGLEVPGVGTIVSSSAEVAEVTPDRIRFSSALGERPEVWLRTDRVVSGGLTRTEGDLTVVTVPTGEDLVVTFD